jgi:hypothetical protein
LNILSNKIKKIYPYSPQVAIFWGKMSFFKKSANQKQELPVAAMFGNGS